MDVAIVVFVLLVIWVVPAVVTGLKGKYGLVALGILLHVCWWVGAIRLAKPDSFWAKRYYDAAKLGKARDRFETGPTVEALAPSRN
jgi:hypothetical protein